MSSLTTTSINTANGQTNLTLSTGNTGGAAIVVTSGSTVAIRANTSANVFIANSTAIRANAAMTVSNTLTVTSPLTANVLTVSTVNSNVNFTGALTFSANVTATGINAASITLGTPSIATSGFSRLPNGLLMQWGTVTGVTASAGTITFPTAFAANPYSVQVQPTHAANGSQISVTGISTTTATVRTTATTTAQTAYYMAIGV
jgi:hypothetical protein